MPRRTRSSQDEGSRTAVNSLLVANHAALTRAPRAPPPTLRGNQPREPTDTPSYQYRGDLTDPAMRPFMTTRADPDGRTAYNDEYPASGLRSVNINSTTGGHAKNPKSAHNYAGAVDINRVNGQPVGFSRQDGGHNRNTDPAVMADVLGLQNAFLRQPGLLEDYGPDYLFKMPGSRPVTNPTLVDMHRTHVHLAMPKPGR